MSAPVETFPLGVEQSEAYEAEVVPVLSVVAPDLDEAMLTETVLTVARWLRPDLDRQRGEAAALPFPAETFDVGLCRSGLMDDTRTEFARYCDPTGALHLSIEGAVITAGSA